MSLPAVPVADRLKQQLHVLRRESENVAELLKLTCDSLKVIANLAAQYGQASIPVVYKTEYDDLRRTLQTFYQTDMEVGHRLRGAEDAERCRVLHTKWHRSSRFVVLNLPLQHRTVMERNPYMRVREAFELPLRCYDLDIDICEIVQDPTNVGVVTWNTPLLDIRSDQLTARIKDTEWHAARNNIHKFQLKTFYSLLMCSLCNQFMFYGLLCPKCNYRCHIKCGVNSPFECTSTDRDWYISNLAPLMKQQRQLPGFVPRLRSQSTMEIQLRLRKMIEQVRTKTEHSSMPTGPSFNGAQTFGMVFKGFWHGPIAIRPVDTRLGAPTRAQQMEAFKQEITMKTKISPSNLLMYLAGELKSESKNITLWCQARSLYYHIHCTDDPFDMPTTFAIARQVAAGMDYLHAQKIVHGDLKSRHVFLLNDLTVRIGGFGVSPTIVRYAEHREVHLLRSIQWIAPEVFAKEADDARFTMESDVYSFGIVLYELFAGRLPYRYHILQIAYMVAKGKLMPDLSDMPAEVPRAVTALIKDCIKITGFARPMFSAVLARLKDIESGPSLRRCSSEPNLRESPVFEFTSGPSAHRDEFRMFRALKQSLRNLFI